MARFDYKLLHALSMVMQEQSFERAAGQLCISQSAVSQRIKQLEEFVARPLIIRGQPLSLTASGEQLLSHFKQVQQLESVLLPQLLPSTGDQPLKFSIALDTDSMTTWFIAALLPLLKHNRIELNLLADNETPAMDKLKSGAAFAAVSQEPQAPVGYQSFELGDMEYILVATETFRQRYFAHGVNADSLRGAPAVSGSKSCGLLQSFICKHFGLKKAGYLCHSVCSAQSFIELACSDTAYALLPKLHIQPQLEGGQLINLLPHKTVNKKLYWHRWAIVRGVYADVSALVIRHARQVLA